MYPSLLRTLKMPPVKSRKSYTAAFKLEVVKFAEENDGNMAAHRKYGVSEKCVRDWRKAKDTLRMTKKSKKANRGCKARWMNLEDKLEEHVLTQRAACRGLNTVQLRERAKLIATDLGIESFRGDPSWCFRFMRRKGLCIRPNTTVAKKPPDDLDERLDNFSEFVQTKYQEDDLEMSNIINMNEVPLIFFLIIIYLFFIFQ